MDCRFAYLFLIYSFLLFIFDCNSVDILLSGGACYTLASTLPIYSFFYSFFSTAYFTYFIDLFVWISSFMSSSQSQNYKQSLPSSTLLESSRLSSYFLFTTSLIQIEHRPISYQISSFKHNLAVSSQPGAHLIWKDWFHLSYLAYENIGVVSYYWSPMKSLINPPFLISCFITASTAQVLIFLFFTIFLSFICFSLWSGFLDLFQLSSTFKVPCLTLSFITSISTYPAAILLAISTIATPINQLPFISSSHDYKKMRSFYDVPMLNYSFHEGVLPPPSHTLVLQLLSAYFTTMKGSILPTVSKSYRQLPDIIFIFNGGFLVFLSIFLSEHQSEPIFFLLSMISITSLGKSAFSASNFSTPWPSIFSLANTSTIISGYLFLSMRISQLQRCLSAGIQQVLIVFSNLPTFILNTGVSSKQPAFKQNRQISFFFISEFIT